MPSPLLYACVMGLQSGFNSLEPNLFCCKFLTKEGGIVVIMMIVRRIDFSAQSKILTEGSENGACCQVVRGEKKVVVVGARKPNPVKTKTNVQVD